MKVLWFTPTPSLSETILHNVPMGGAWIKSLERVVQNQVDLSIAFYHDKNVKPFRSGNSTYYPIKDRKSGTIGSIKKRLLHQIESKRDVNAFIKIVEAVKPDLIHIHGTERPFGLIQLVSNIPTVVSIQGNITVYKTKFFSGIPLVNVLKYSSFKNYILFKTLLNDYVRFRKQAVRERQIFKLSKHFIGRTDWDRRISSVLSPFANYYYNNEILRDSFYDEMWSNNIEPSLNLFTINGPDIYKGVETIIACAYLLDLNNINYSWRVAGLSMKDEIVTIASKSVKKKVSKNLEFLGRLNESQIKNNILNSHLYISTSHIENSPNSLCEALLLGAPCIATYAGGTSNFIEDKISGILIQDGDPYSMAGAILELKNDYNRAILYGKNARKKALLIHDKNEIAKDLLNIYKDILNKAKPPSL